MFQGQGQIRNVEFHITFWNIVCIKVTFICSCITYLLRFSQNGNVEPYVILKCENWLYTCHTNGQFSSKTEDVMRVNEYHIFLTKSLVGCKTVDISKQTLCVFLQEIDACVNNLLLIRFFNCINCCCLLLSLSLYCRVGQSAVSCGQVKFPRNHKFYVYPLNEIYLYCNLLLHLRQ